MFSFSDVKMMYDWGCFTDDQVRLFVPLCITDEEADKIISKDESASQLMCFFVGKLVEHERRSAPRRCGEISKN